MSLLTTTPEGARQRRRELLDNPTFPFPKPEISLRRIRRINTYEVIESDLEDLDRSIQAENQALAFTCLCLGGLISTVISWIGASSLTPHGLAAYLSITVLLLVGSTFFGITWLREKRSKRGLLERIRSQTLLTEEESWKSST